MPTTTSEDPISLLSEYRSLLSLHNAHAPTPRPHIALHDLPPFGQWPPGARPQRFPPFSFSPLSPLPTGYDAAARPFPYGAQTTNPSAPNPAAAGQRHRMPSLPFMLFLAIVVLVSWIRGPRDGERTPRRRRQLHYRQPEAEDPMVQRRRIDLAAEEMRSKMQWSEVAGKGVAVDDGWRYRMREKERRRRLGLPMPLPVQQDVKMPDVEVVYALPPQETDGAVAQILELLGRALAICGYWFEIMIKTLLKTFAAGSSLYLLYRTIAYFTKEEYERQGNSLDWFLTIALHFTTSLFLTLILPITIVFGFGYLIIRHDDIVKVCNLCGRHNEPIDQRYVNHTIGIDLCLKCRWEQETRISSEKALESWKAQRAYQMGTTPEAIEEKIQKQKAREKEREEEERQNVQTASTLPSGQRFSPSPHRPRPRRPEVLDLLCKIEDEAKRYSDFRLHNPGEKKYRQKLYNAWEARQAFMPPIAEEADGDVRRNMKGAKTWKEVYFADYNARGGRRVLWPSKQQPTPTPTTTTTSSKWEKTPNKRFL